MIEGSVDETAGTGVEVHMLQPGFGWVPWWKSRVYPFGEHVKYMKDRFGSTVPKGGWAEYMASGGDMVEVFTKRCREKKLAPFVSLRMNDATATRCAGPQGSRNETAWATLAPIHVEHPEWRLGSKLGDWSDRPLNWTIPQVREYKLRMIEEFAGSIRWPVSNWISCGSQFFDGRTTTREQRVAIMRKFIGQVRRILDGTAPAGQRRWLCVRVPAFLAAYDAMGIDLAAWVRAGVDMVNLSYFYFTAQDGDLAAIRRQVPDAAVYVEMCHTTRVGPVVGVKAATTTSLPPHDPGEFYTTAHGPTARTGRRERVQLRLLPRTRDGPRGPFCEPPFEVFEHLATAHGWRGSRSITSLPKHGTCHPCRTALPKTIPDPADASFRTRHGPADRRLDQARPPAHPSRPRTWETAAGVAVSTARNSPRRRTVPSRMRTPIPRCWAVPNITAHGSCRPHCRRTARIRLN